MTALGAFEELTSFGNGSFPHGTISDEHARGKLP